MPLAPEDVADAISLLLDARLGKAPQTEAEILASVRVFCACFQDWTIEQFQRAIIAYLNSGAPGSDFWPTPGKLRAALPEAAAVQAVAADEVWPLVLASLAGTSPIWDSSIGQTRPAYGYFRWNLMQRLGQDRSLLDRACEALGRERGYLDLCGTPADQLSVARAAFRRAWEAGGQRREVAASMERVSLVLGLGQRMLPGGEA